ncbi:hypothetical protein OHA72_17025 [Dactylosporangium sp. NBC_01737]|uniref:hypothetical protein n=1 Tax=Dactylosporangium sp. NBC_01737 TaxID=2975959 RepID=UPI002E0FABEE|nr:hypothetical protein OHA72_17025 [Dactylosporangium sp. NBC_01737]
MGQGIKFKIDDVRHGATTIKADGERFKTEIQPRLEELNLPWTAFPIGVPVLHTSYEQARTGLNEVAAGIGDALIAVGDALGKVATYYEEVERRHAKELGIS